MSFRLFPVAVLVFLLGTIRVIAQKSEIGLRLGLNVALETVTSKPFPDFEASPRAGLLAGGYAKFMISNKVGIQPELLYSQTGSNITISNTTTSRGIFANAFPLPSGNGDVLTNYLSLPVFLRIEAIKHVHILVGPQYSLLLTAKSTFNGYRFDTTNSFNMGDFSIVGGVGIDIGVFNVGARYAYGLSNIEKNSGDETIANRVFQLVGGYRLFGK